MKFSILKENLNKALSSLVRNLSTGQQLPILANILIKVKKGEIELTATNLDIGVIYTLLAKTKTQGEITIPGKMLADFVNLLPPEKIKFEKKKNNLNVKTKTKSASFTTMPPDDFPSFPKVDKSPNTFSLGKLKDAVSRVTFSASTDEGRPVLTGVKTTITNGKMTLMATDGYRLSREELTGFSKKESLDVVLPAKALSEVIRISQEVETDKLGFSLLKDKNQACFTFPNIFVFTRIIEGKFPDVEKIIPTTFKTKAVLDREEFLKAVKTVSLFAKGAANIIKIKIEKKGLRLTASTPQVGEGEDFIEAEISGEEDEISFNYRFLIDLLSSFPGDKVVFEASGPLSPGVFRPSMVKPSYLHLIMPVRVQKQEDS